MADAVFELRHHHAEINAAILELTSLMRTIHPDSSTFGSSTLTTTLTRVRDLVFSHFAREEEGLFPFLEEVAPDLGSSVAEMLDAHDAICGALARMVDLSTSETTAKSMLVLFERFESAYAQHARKEELLLSAADQRLDRDQRARLGAVLDGI